MSHPALEEHPRYVEQMARVTEVEARADNIRQQALEHQRQVDQAAREQEAAIAEAVATGGPIPPTPPAAPLNDNLQSAEYAIRHEQAAAKAETERLIASIAGDVEQTLRKAVAVQMKSVRTHAEQVEVARLKVEDALRAAARVRRAVENGQSEVTRPSRADRTRPTVATAELLDMARFGVDPLEPLAVGFRDARILGGSQVEDRSPSPAEHREAMLKSLPAEVQERLRCERDVPARF